MAPEMHDPGPDLDDELAEARALLARERADLAEAQRIAHVGSWTWDVASGRVTWSDEMYRIHGFEPRAFEVDFQKAMACIVPEDAERIAHDLATKLSDPAGPSIMGGHDYRVRWLDGTFRTVVGHGRVERDASGRAVRLTGTVQDVTEERQIKAALAAHAAELERSNLDLERFAYAASHDLQEPLRVARGFLELVADQTDAALEGCSREYLGHAQASLVRMEHLIRDLLEYSRIGTRGLPLAPIAAEAAFEDALANLSVAIAETHATIEHDPFPAVLADRAQLTAMFQNLLANAIKFRSQAAPHVRVSAHPEGDAWQFDVEDNGIGIDPKDTQRLFVVFQRLHGERVPGNGIGLALCKRIAERHGGRIWVDSRPGAGSTFHFTLPGVARE